MKYWVWLVLKLVLYQFDIRLYLRFNKNYVCRKILKKLNWFVMNNKFVRTIIITLILFFEQYYFFGSNLTRVMRMGCIILTLYSCMHIIVGLSGIIFVSSRVYYNFHVNIVIIITLYRISKTIRGWLFPSTPRHKIIIFNII